MEKKLACQEVFEAVVAAGRGRERSKFRVNGNSQSRRSSAGRYQNSL